MTDLIACVSDEKGVLAHLQRVIDGEEWSRILLISSNDFKAEFSRKTEVVKVDLRKTLSELIEQLKGMFRMEIKDTEAAVNLICGSGKEHMAILSALLKSGVGIRFVALTKEGVKEV